MMYRGFLCRQKNNNEQPNFMWIPINLIEEFDMVHSIYAINMHNVFGNDD